MANNDAHNGWLEVRSHPGFAVDLTSWQASISPDGHVLQRVSKARQRTAEETTRMVTLIRAGRTSEIKRSDCYIDEDYSSQLTAGQLHSLQTRVSRVNFPLVAGSFSKFAICDAPEVTITLHSEQGVQKCSGPFGILTILPDHVEHGILPADEARTYRATFEPFVELWTEIEKLMPWTGA